ncbi:phosphatase domain-containing protein [Bdellovibrio sp. NC01]|uniref:phosphatase domain-containing protein n=1 Tax=Bdellovibrio sp. NC01 TaxID=2220073 RepID=UPI0011584B42|nr:phosphatase domain-containing protein [Bdellovibrio sp. NC01]QDK37756.1 hypothetical protein DOE51_09260 [Bdellovibrio sp. NC01]
MKLFSLVFVALLWISAAQAKTLVIADVDDTIKLADVQDLDDAAVYSFDENSRYLGMSELFALIQKDNADASFYYVTRAPAWWMQKTHLNFLRNGSFPAGVYIPRTNYSSDEHKLRTITAIMNEQAPDKVIFFGDNTEADASVYEAIKNKYAPAGIQFFQYIRWVYSTQGREQVGTPIYADQTGFVSPVEVSFELRKQGLLSEDSVLWTMENIASAILKQKKDYEVGVVAFPKFMRCNDFVWKWDDVGVYPYLSEYKERVLQRCQKR